MTISKSLLYTVLFFIFIQVSSTWMNLNKIYNIQYFIEKNGRFISGLIELIGVLFLFHFLRKKILLTPKKSQALFYSIAVIIAIIYVFTQKALNFIYDIVFKTNFYEKINYDFSPSLNNFNLNNIAIVLLLPISEELFFRGFIQDGLYKKYNAIIAIIISSLLFASLHLPFTHSIFLAFFGGLISASLFHMSKSTIPSIVFHITWNLMVIVS